MAYDVERQFDTIRANGGQTDCRMVGAPDGQGMAVLPASVRSSDGSAPKSTATIQHVADLYLNDPTSARTAKSLLVYRTTYAAFIDIP